MIAINAALLVGAGYWSLTRDFNTRAERDIDLSLRTLTLAFAEAYPDTRITTRDGIVDRVEITRMPEFTDHHIVDRAISYVGGNATLFFYDDTKDQFVRRATNVKKENGDRAVGTHLAENHPGQAIIRSGHAYRGPAVLFGSRFYTAYHPVFNPAGKVIGIIYVQAGIRARPQRGDGLQRTISVNCRDQSARPGFQYRCRGRGQTG